MANLAGGKLWRMCFELFVCIYIYLWTIYFIYFIYTFPHLFIFIFLYLFPPGICGFIFFSRAIGSWNILVKFVKVRVTFSEVTCDVGCRNSTPSWLMLTMHGDGQPRWLTFWAKNMLAPKRGRLVRISERHQTTEEDVVTGTIGSGGGGDWADMAHRWT